MRIALSSVGVPVHRVQASLVCQTPTSGRDNIIGKLKREPVANVKSDAVIVGLCRRKMRMSGLSKVEMSAFMDGVLARDLQRTAFLNWKESCSQMFPSLRKGPR